MTKEQRKSLILAAQHQVKEVKRQYKEGKTSLEALIAVNKVIEVMIAQIDIEYNKPA